MLYWIIGVSVAWVVSAFFVAYCVFVAPEAEEGPNGLIIRKKGKN